MRTALLGTMREPDLGPVERRRVVALFRELPARREAQGCGNP